MGKVEINNEIVRMRQLVRQARVCIIHKLTKEAKTLRAKNGTEKQQEKNKRKADKLISEIYALKKIKDDRITKFGITSKKSLQEILQTKNISESTRIMARVADYKSLKNAIIQLRETYPDYEEYLQPGKKKSIKQKVISQGKEDNKIEKIETKRETRASSREASNRSTKHMDELSSDECTDEGNNNDLGINDKDSENSEIENDIEQHNSEPGSILRIKPPTCVQIEHKEKKCMKRNRKQSTESIEEHDGVCDNNNSKDVKKVRVKETSKEDKEQGTIKVISKQATVKRFTELLQEQTSEEDGSLKEKDEKVTAENNPEPEKKVDSFFMSGDGDAYLSVAKSVVEENKDFLEDEDNNYNYNKSRRYTNKRTFTNDRFFSNIKSTDEVIRKGKQRESRQNDKDFIRNRDSFRKQRDSDTSSVRNATKKCTNDVRENSNENLHPSWAAKKKQQEIIKQGFQGKKIVFSDD